MAAADTTYSSAPTVATTGVATTPAACSARPAMGAMKQHRAGSAAWSSPTPPSGRASRSPPGRPPSQARARARAPALPSVMHRPAAGNPGHPGGHPACVLAPDPARSDRSWLKTQPQDLDGRGWHPGDPRRAAARPPGAADARPVCSRLAPDARRPDSCPPSPMGRIPQRPRGHPPALTRATTRRTTGTAARRNPRISRASDTRRTPQQPPTPGDREKLISQIPPKSAASPTRPTRMEPVLRASDLARHQDRLSGAKGTRTPDPLLAKIVDSAA